MDKLDLDARLGEYCQHLVLLKQKDIREPNQSLILDFFCIDEAFTDFLRKDVFCNTTARFKTWKFINLRESDPCGILDNKELANLLEYKDFHVKELWAEIVKNTAKHQNNLEILIKISNLITNSEDVILSSSKQVIESTGWVESDTPISMDSNDTKIQSIRNTVIHVSSSRIGVGSSSPRQINLSLLAFLCLSAFVSVAAMIGSTLNLSSTSSTDYQTPKLSASSDDISGLNQLEADSKEAVLICELRPIIERANSLKLSDQSLISRRSKIVSDANTSIDFLNQTSGMGFKYWEDPSCTWGQQWFDNNANNEFRVFIAISKKCSSPVIHYKYTKDEEAKVITERNTYNADGHQKGEMRLPFPQDLSYTSYIFIDMVTCAKPKS